MKELNFGSTPPEYANTTKVYLAVSLNFDLVMTTTTAIMLCE